MRLHLTPGKNKLNLTEANLTYYKLFFLSCNLFPYNLRIRLHNLMVIKTSLYKLAFFCGEDKKWNEFAEWHMT